MPERAPNGARIRHDRKYCSDKCRWDSRRTANRYGMTERHCLHCGAAIPMEATLKRKFCSHKCKRDYYNAIRDTAAFAAKQGRTCLCCGEPIPPARSALALYCSKRCKVTVQIQRTARKRAEAKRAKG